MALETPMVTENMIEAAKAEAKALADRAGIDIGDDQDMFVDDLAQTLTRFAALSPDAEPVAWQAREKPFQWLDIPSIDVDLYRKKGHDVRALYAAPPAPSVAVNSLIAEWKTARSEFCALPAGAPEMRAALNRLSNAEDALSRYDTALSAQVQDVAGMKLMPHEPTQEMLDAATRTDQDGFSASMKTIWMVMWGTFAAAPAAKLEVKP